jgi:PilZ domain
MSQRGEIFPLPTTTRSAIQMPSWNRPDGRGRCRANITKITLSAGGMDLAPHAPMRAAKSSLRAIETRPERRVSLRTPTSVDVRVRQGRSALKGRAIDLSQSGVLVMHRASRSTAVTAIAEIELRFPDGAARIMARPVRRAGKGFAYAFVALDERDQSLLTDYLFCRLVEEGPRELPSGVRHRAPRRNARKART